MMEEHLIPAAPVPPVSVDLSLEMTYRRSPVASPHSTSFASEEESGDFMVQQDVLEGLVDRVLDAQSNTTSTAASSTGSSVSAAKTSTASSIVSTEVFAYDGDEGRSEDGMLSDSTIY